jgi:hypothetical protein
MSLHLSPVSAPSCLSRPARLACAAAACVVSVAIGTGLAGLYHGAGEPVWLVATPAVLEEIAVCDREATHGQRQQCRKDFVAARLPIEARWVHVAER